MVSLELECSDQYKKSLDQLLIYLGFIILHRSTLKDSDSSSFPQAVINPQMSQNTTTRKRVRTRYKMRPLQSPMVSIQLSSHENAIMAVL